LLDPSVDGKLILRPILLKWEGGTRTSVIWLTTGTVGGLM
jgi:hypothetical protein